jgi:hypothetical protein
MANYNVSITQSIEVQPANISASQETTFTIANPLSASSYFTLETARNNNGFYDSTSPKNTSGSFSLGTGLLNIIQSDYITSVVVAPGGGTLTFTPANDITGSTLYLRGVGSKTSLNTNEIIQQFIELGGYTNSAVISVIEEYYYQLISNNLFNKIEYAYPFIADQATSSDILNQCALNIKDPTKYKIDWVNNPTGSLAGVQFNAASKQYGNTNFIISRDKQHLTSGLASSGVYLVTNLGNSPDFGSNGLLGASFAQASNLGTDLYNAMNSNIYFNTLAIVVPGFITQVRNNSSQFFIRANGTPIFTANTPHISFCDLPMLIGALGPITNNFYSNNLMNHNYIAAFNLAETQLYETIVNNLQGQLETALGLAPGTRKKY